MIIEGMDSTILEIMKKVIKKLMEEAPNLFDLDVQEDSITTRFAIYLEEILRNENYIDNNTYVDCQYNRQERGIKEIPFRNLEGEETGIMQNIIPDLVVHSRNNDANNKIVIEFKRNKTINEKVEKTLQNNEGEEVVGVTRALRKLRDLKSEGYNYIYALGIEYRTDRDYSIIRFINRDENYKSYKVDRRTFNHGNHRCLRSL